MSDNNDNDFNIVDKNDSCYSKHEAFEMEKENKDIMQEDLNPIYDNVIRDWARISSYVKNAVKQIDAKRINVLQDIYGNLGYNKKTAEFRAKIMYYHQIGYQTLEVEESLDQRLMNAAYYAEIISENPQKYPYNNPDGVLSIMKSNLGKNK